MSVNNQEVLVIQTGGTIDKTYPRSILGYAFEITEPAAGRIISRAKPNYPVEYVTSCRKDSQDVTDSDRKQMVEICLKSEQNKILITHGTDTMIETAAYLAKHDMPKRVIITGSFIPEAFKDSDADVNIGLALGALQTMNRNGVYIAMNGQVHVWNEVNRDKQTFMFTNKM